MNRRRSLFRKYLITFVSLVSGVLMASSLTSLYFSYHENRNSLLNLQREKADSAASRIEQYLFEIVHQIGLTAPLKLGEDALARRKQEIRLLRQVPAITDVLLLDRDGKEQLRISRAGMDLEGSLRDYSHTVAFQEAQSGQPYFSPVYFRRNTEPYITIAMAVGPEEAGITVAEINLQFLLDGIRRIQTGTAGNAYAVDARGQLIAHPDLALVLKKTDFSSLPQVRAALATAPGEHAQAVDGVDLQGSAVLSAYGTISPLGWHVFVEQPQAEAFGPLRASITRNGLLLLLGLGLAIFASAVLVRKMVTPMRALQEGTARIGEGSLDQRIEVQTGDELEELATQFNRMVRQSTHASAWST